MEKEATLATAEGLAVSTLDEIVAGQRLENRVETNLADVEVSMHHLDRGRALGEIEVDESSAGVSGGDKLLSYSSHKATIDWDSLYEGSLTVFGEEYVTE